MYGSRFGACDSLELTVKLSLTVNRRMMCCIVLFWGLTVAFSEAIDASHRCSGEQPPPESEASTMWPLVMMVTVGG